MSKNCCITEFLDGASRKDKLSCAAGSKTYKKAGVGLQSLINSVHMIAYYDFNTNGCPVFSPALNSVVQ